MAATTTTNGTGGSGGLGSGGSEGSAGGATGQGGCPEPPPPEVCEAILDWNECPKAGCGWFYNLDYFTLQGYPFTGS